MAKFAKLEYPGYTLGETKPDGYGAIEQAVFKAASRECPDRIYIGYIARNQHCAALGWSAKLDGQDGKVCTGETPDGARRALIAAFEAR